MSVANGNSPLSVLGVTSNEVYALTLLSFDEEEPVAYGPTFDSLLRKGYITNTSKVVGLIQPHLTEKARTLLATFHR